ncbi:Putative glucose-6-phosphate 1-epimerase [Poriferisphaera corsica]|uniref:Putative glucose-6-phosphate 1-epimerase n=1 Tax=Poriferisphaera corsica TaxID=2528020 RepID=A0A517YYL6_9BACT|nr:D-hexose-6-phosphate mutarotase [Poriferisphaera corsica]QDU35301.1 Putative glucose-6-phosphate 1-epimerase [Poriferisphaera corsica]
MNHVNQSIEDLNEYFSIDDVLRFEIGEGGLTRAVITHNLCKGELYLHGAHISRFQPSGFADILFLSSNSQYEADQPIRGGVPIVFPWFGPNKHDNNLPMHGYARTMEWQMARADYHSSKLVLELKAYIAPFELQYFVAFSEHLTMTLRVNNPTDEVHQFEEALHTYFSVGDITKVTIRGLEYDSFINKIDHFRIHEGESNPITITGETDRVYIDTAGTSEIVDPTLRRRIFIDKHHSKSTVVWNPWIDKSQRMTDFKDDEWKQMVCIESANVDKNIVQLQPHRFHEMTTVIRPIAY